MEIYDGFWSVGIDMYVENDTNDIKPAHGEGFI